MKPKILASVCFYLLFIMLTARDTVYAKVPVVNAVLFFTQNCPQCKKVIDEDLNPLVEKYGEQLLILGVNTYTQQGLKFYRSSIDYLQIPRVQRGVPILIVGDRILVGSSDISQEFPGFLAMGLAVGGIDWPNLPGLKEILGADSLNKSEVIPSGKVDSEKKPYVYLGITEADSVLNYESIAGENNIQVNEPSRIRRLLDQTAWKNGYLCLIERYAQDKVGNTIAIFVLMIMSISVVWVCIIMSRGNTVLKSFPSWSISLLVIIGLVVAIYMCYVEITQTEAGCGPVGDCNSVQQSPYAFLFGIIPIGFIGIAGYLIIGFFWLINSIGPKEFMHFNYLSLWVITLFGTLFFIYITFLEPFVIGATCAWCLTSAIVMTMLLWATTSLALKVLKEDFKVYNRSRK